ncbi:MAG: 3-keto-steroid reductase [Alectoria sarmentosa]|nr:MAG: 3-keto-steroid reductase [Alectoria sarmentosa]
MDETDDLHPRDNEQHSYILVTGVNSGLGFAICCRLINEFISSRPTFECLTLVITTRDSRKSDGAVKRLERHLERQTREVDALLKHRISIQPEQVDLTSLRSVQTLSTRLLQNLPRLDTIICNAGYGGFTGIDWPIAIKETLTDFFTSLTYPSYKLSATGETTVAQTGSSNPGIEGGSHQKNEPPLGQVFASNVFGHYLLAHQLIPLLSASPDRGRIVFISSIEPLASHFNPADIQGLASPKAYESSKRLTDIIVLTSSLPSTKPFVQRFLTPSPTTPSQSISLLDNEPSCSTRGSTPDTPPQRISLSDNEHRPPANPEPKIYISHPGICATSIVTLSLIPFYLRILAFYIARWLGSPWHTVSPYKGACAPVWLALADQDELEDIEQMEGKGKWGSVCDRAGHERVMRTAVEGWGLGGRMGEGDVGNRIGSRRGFREVTREDREDFEELGRECWREMEGLRMAWEERLRTE